jgi:hypothetical protein
MLKRTLQTAFVVFPTLLAVNSTASAATETFNFSYLTGWNGTDTSLTGSFTGTVEPDGLIERSDLTSFTATLITGTPPPIIASIDLSELTEFSYDTTGGVSSLSYIASVPVSSPPPIYWCAGAAAVLDAGCNPGGDNQRTCAPILLMVPWCYTPRTSLRSRESRKLGPGRCSC